MEEMKHDKKHKLHIYKEVLKTNYQQVNISKKILFFLVLFFIGLMSASVTHAETYGFVTKWGSQGSDDGQFYYPYGVDIDSSDNVYVADISNNRIQKFDINNAYLTKLGSWGSGDGQFAGPSDIAVDSSGNIYVADAYNDRIQKFSSSGAFLTKWGSYGSGDGQFASPSGIAVDSSGNVYVTDASNSRIQKFDSSGTFITKWGSYGNGIGQFYQPWGIAVDSSDNIYVGDVSNRRIQKFDSNGTFITKWGSSGINEGQFSYIYGVAVDSSDNVYVADTENQRIQKFDSSGTFITKWGSVGNGDGQFHNPHGIDVDSSGNVYVVDTGNHRIQKFYKEKITPTIIWSNPADITYGKALSNTQLNADSSVSGTFVYTPSSGTVLDVGTQVLHVDFTPTDTKVYNTASINVSINVLEPLSPPVASFKGNITSGYAPLTVQFTDLSEDATEWSWNFGDKTYSTEKNPVHTYIKDSKYTVNLTVKNSLGMDTIEKAKYISVLKRK